MHFRHLYMKTLAVAMAAAATIGSPAAASAQGRYGDTQFPRPEDYLTRRFPAVAYDGANDAYLVAWGLQSVGVRFVSPAGIPLGEPVQVNYAAGGATRVACGAAINACMVTWIQEPASIMGRLVRYSGGAVAFLTEPFLVSSPLNINPKLNSAAPGVTFSPAAGGEFLVAWTEFAGPNVNVIAQRISSAGTQVGLEIPIAVSGAYEGFPSLTYNTAKNEYVVAYYYEPSWQGVVLQPVKPLTGELVTGSILYAGFAEQYPEVAYNSVDNQYLAVTWHAAAGHMLHGRRADGNAQPIGDVFAIAPGGCGDGIGLAHNPVNNHYLAVFQTTTSDEIWGAFITNTGVPGEKFQITVSGATQASTQPQVAASTKTGRWLVDASFNYRMIMSQAVELGGSGVAPPPPPAGPAPVGDFDGDRKGDLAVYRPSAGTFYHYSSATGDTVGHEWGMWSDLPVAGDYDGDGRADAAVFRPSDGMWYLRFSRTGTSAGVQWGGAADVPVPGDYDGDGRTDIAVFRPANGLWYLRYSSNGGTAAVRWGGVGDRPVFGDFDGDQRTDVGVFRPSNGIWYVRFSSNGAGAAVQWGNASDVPVAGDYDGDRLTDIGVFRPSNGVWYLRYANGSSAAVQWGSGADLAVPSDYDGDGRMDVAVFRPSNATWYVRHSSTGAALGFQWGSVTDVPVLKR